MRTQRTYPHLFEIWPLTMRTQGILFVKDMIMVMAHCSGGGVDPAQWKQISDELVTRIDEYSDSLLRNERMFREIGDILGTEIIQSSCVGCLAHLAVLCDLTGRLNPNSKPQMDTVCDSALERLGSLTQRVNLEEYTYLDLLLKVSWEKSLVAFDSRIGSLPYGESASLRYFRNIVADAWSDFEAGLPENSPSQLSVSLTFIDGREAGSKYSNFMLASERATYGI